MIHCAAVSFTKFKFRIIENYSSLAALPRSGDPCCRCVLRSAAMPLPLLLCFVSNLCSFCTFRIVTRRSHIHKANSFHHLHLTTLSDKQINLHRKTSQNTARAILFASYFTTLKRICHDSFKYICIKNSIPVCFWIMKLIQII